MKIGISRRYQVILTAGGGEWAVEQYPAILGTVWAADELAARVAAAEMYGLSKSSKFELRLTSEAFDTFDNLPFKALECCRIEVHFSEVDMQRDPSLGELVSWVEQHISDHPDNTLEVMVDEE